MTKAEGFKDQGEYTPDNLLAGEYPRVERVVTIAAGADLAKGAVLGRITANGKFKLSASASADGSQTPDAVLAEKANAADNDVQAVVYFSGEFNENALSFKPDNDALVSDFKASARKVCIFFKPFI